MNKLVLLPRSVPHSQLTEFPIKRTRISASERDFFYIEVFIVPQRLLTIRQKKAEIAIKVVKYFAMAIEELLLM